MKNCNKNLKPHKRIYHHGKKKPRRDNRANFCPDCGAILAPGKECKCLYELPTENHRKPQTKRGDRHEQR